MGAAVWLRLRAALRARWRALVALALLAGLPGGVIVAALVGADRTGSVIDRLAAATNAPDIFMVPAFQETKLAFADVAALPVVAGSAIIDAFPTTSPAPAALEIYAPRTASAASQVHVVRGRLPDPSRLDEGVINFRAAHRYGWDVGDVVPIGIGVDGVGRPIRIRITALIADPGDFVGIAQPALHLTSAFGERYRPDVGTIEVFAFRLRRGSDDLAAFRRGIERLSGGAPVLYVEARSGFAQARRGFRLQASALRAFAGALALAVAFIFGQSMARQTTLESDDLPTLRALGMTRRSMVALGLARATVVAVVAGITCAIAGGALTRFTPLGTARLAEPMPGISLPAVWYVGGVAALALGVIAVSAIPAYRAPAVALRPAPRLQVSAIAHAVASVFRRPAAAMGARLALEPGGGASMVPVRTSLAASITGIAVLLAALAVGTSIRHLLNTPTLYGATWDARLSGAFGEGSDDLGALTGDPRIADVATGFAGEGTLFRVGEVAAEGLALDPVAGSIQPAVLAGRAPAITGEIALGRKTLQQAGLRIGDLVTLGIQGVERSRPAEVVGVVVLPFDDDISSIGDGVWTTLGTLRALVPDLPATPDAALVRFAPDIDPDAARADLSARFGELFDTRRPGVITDFARISDLMVPMAGVLALVAAGTLAHVLGTSVRRRRRDLAILQTIGFTGREVRATVRWQAIVFAGATLVVASPIGVALGRWAWTIIAAQQGFGAVTVYPPGAVAVVAGGTLVASLAIAFLPARAGARIRPARALRSE